MKLGSQHLMSVAQLCGFGVAVAGVEERRGSMGAIGCFCGCVIEVGPAAPMSLQQINLATGTDHLPETRSIVWCSNSLNTILHV